MIIIADGPGGRAGERTGRTTRDRNSKTPRMNLQEQQRPGQEHQHTKNNSDAPGNSKTRNRAPKNNQTRDRNSNTPRSTTTPGTDTQRAGGRASGRTGHRSRRTGRTDEPNEPDGPGRAGRTGSEAGSVTTNSLSLAICVRFKTQKCDH